MTYKATAIDFFNQVMTGEIVMTFRATRADTDHIPCVIVEVGNDLPESDRGVDGEQPSGQLLRTGRIQ